MQKPMGLQQLIDTVEDKEAYEALKKVIASIRKIKDSNPTNVDIQTISECKENSEIQDILDMSQPRTIKLQMSPARSSNILRRFKTYIHTSHTKSR
jgi:hypothetical protein